MSSEDPTQQLPSGADTKPSLEAVIPRIDRLGALGLERVVEFRSKHSEEANSA